MPQRWPLTEAQLLEQIAEERNNSILYVALSSGFPLISARIVGGAWGGANNAGRREKRLKLYLHLCQCPKCCEGQYSHHSAQGLLSPLPIRSRYKFKVQGYKLKVQSSKCKVVSPSRYTYMLEPHHLALHTWSL